MATLTALYDSCVLYPAPLRDLLVRLGGTGLFRARWTNQIHDEWIRSVLENRSDLTRERLERTRDLMNEHILDSLVTDYEDLIPAIALPDADDRHVVAAAIRGRADVIVTFNLKDFPASVLSHYNIEAQHPDVFVQRLLDLNEGLVCATIRQQRRDLKKPPKPAEAVLNTLEEQGLKQSVARLRPLIMSLKSVDSVPYTIRTRQVSRAAQTNAGHSRLDAHCDTSLRGSSEIGMITVFVILCVLW